MFLYLLNMEKSDMFKVGIATDFSRIKQHMSTYKGLINLKKSYIINAKEDSTIKLFEKQILEDYKDFKIDEEIFEGKDGHTELLDIKVLDDVLDDVKYKKNKFSSKEIQIIKNIIIKNEKIKSHAPFIRENNDDAYNLIKTVFEKVKIQNITFNIFETNSNYRNEIVKVIDTICFSCSDETLLLIKKMLQLQVIHRYTKNRYIIHKIFACSIHNISDGIYSVKFNEYPTLKQTLDILTNINKCINIVNNYYFYNKHIINHFDELLKELCNEKYGNINGIYIKNKSKEYETNKQTTFCIEFENYDKLYKFHSYIRNRCIFNIYIQNNAEFIIQTGFYAPDTNTMGFTLHLDAIKTNKLNIFYKIATKYFEGDKDILN